MTTRNRTFLTLAVVAMACFAMTTSAHAALVSFDDFSSLDNTGGTGWSGNWTDDGSYDNGTATGFNDAVSPEYVTDFGYLIRSLTAPLSATSTDNVWTAVYLRPQGNFSGWQFGFEVGVRNGTSNLDAGAQIGMMSGNDGQLRTARQNAESQEDSGYDFVLGQPTLLLIHMYKNAPTDTVFNRADFYADLDGSDGRANDLISLRTNLDLATKSASVVDAIRLLCYVDGSRTTDFDYVAIGTTQASVLIPEPATMSLLAFGGLGVLLKRRRRRA